MSPFHRAERLVSAVVAFEDANFGAVPFDRIGRAPIKCALPPHLPQRIGRMNFCSLTTNERLSTAPPATNIPRAYAIRQSARN